MKYRIALPAAAATASLALAPAMASAAQRPGPSPRPPHQGSVTYTESLTRTRSEATVTVTGGKGLRQQPYRIVIFDPEHEVYGVGIVSSTYQFENGKWVVLYGHGNGGVAHSTEVFPEITGLPPAGQRYVFTVEVSNVSPLPTPVSKRTLLHLIPIPVIVEGLGLVR